MPSSATQRVEGSATWRRVVAMAPDAILALFMAVCLAVTIAISLDEFTPWLVMLLLVVLTPLLVRFVPPPPSADGAEVTGSVASILLAVVWAVLNMPYAAQLLWVTRDPGIYTVTGVWLSDHDSGGIDIRFTDALHRQISSLSSSLAPFSTDDGTTIVHGQGGLTLPGLMGLGGWLDGTDGVLRANLVVGAIALVGMYGLARRFVRPWLALAAEVALGLTVAFMYLMRAPYSEGIMLAGGMAALIWFVVACRTRRSSFAAVAGLFLGVGSMARVDGPILLAGAGVLATFLFAVAGEADIVPVRRLGLILLGSGASSCLFGLLSLHLTQRRYLNDLRGEAIQLWTAVAASFALAAVVLAARAAVGRRSRRRAPSDRAVSRVGTVLGLAVPLVFAFWWSRPLWWEGHFIPADSPYAGAVEFWQQQEGLPIDGTRSYDEMTLHWVAWYFGWGAVVLAAVGLGIMLRRAVARRELDLLVLVVPTAVAAMLYFDKVSVTPDQVWAYRRLLPVITPGLLVGALFAAEWWLRRPVRRPLRYGVAIVAVLLVAAGPLPSWNDLLRLPEGQGARAFIDQLCGGLTADTVMVATGHEPAYLPLTIRTVCGREAVSGDATDPDSLRRLASAAGDVQVVAFARADLPRRTSLRKPNLTETLTFWRHGLTGPPRISEQVTWQAWIGHIEDGRFVQDPTGR